ncbi:MAG: serine--tRNA ligase, partial [Ginsengibacter sp.]
MLQVNFIKDNRQMVLERLAVKQFKDVAAIDRVIALDDERKSLQHESEELSGKINAVSRQIGELIQKGNKIESEKKKVEVAELKSLLQPLTQKLETVEKDLNHNLLVLPNLPHASVPHGKTPAENEIVREGGDKPILANGAEPHWELAKKYDLINFDLGNKVTGSGFPFYKNKGSKLQRSLIQYFLDYNVKAGYTEYQPPLLVNEQSAFGTGQLPDKEGQM